MARGLNQVTIMGNLTRDPELKDMPSGQPVCNISIALNRSYKDSSGEWQDATDFVDVVMWAGLAERVNTYLRKGSKALVTGRLQTREWEKDGKKHYRTEVLASDVIFLDKREEVTDTQSGYEQAKAKAQEIKAKQVDVVADMPDDDEPINLEDIPF